MSLSSTSSQTAEAILSRARRLSSNAFERTRPPTTFAEGEDHGLAAPILSGTLSHRSSLSGIHLDPSRRRSCSLQQHRRSSISQRTPPLGPVPTMGLTIIPSRPSSVDCKPQVDLADPPASPVLVQSPMGDESGGPFDPASTGENDDKHADNNASDSTDSHRVGPHLPDQPAYANAFLDPNRAHTLACATLGSRRSSLAIANRPRALTLEAIRETTGPDSRLEGHEDSFSPRDSHRKHKSELGGSLVHGVLEALRQQIELDSPNPGTTAVFSGHSREVSMEGGLDTEDGEDAEAESRIAGVSSEEGEARIAIESMATAEMDTSAVPEDDEGRVPATATTSSTSSSSTVEQSQEHLGHAPNEELPTLCTPPMVITEVIVTPTEERPSPTDTPILDSTAPSLSSDESPSPPKAESPAMSSASASLPAMDHESRGHSFLAKMGMRKNSVSEVTTPQDTSDSSSVKSGSTLLSASHGHSKLSKRSSKLFGKLVPKFLQTSFSPTISSGSLSPRSQAASLSPLSTPSSRSGSIGGHSPVTKTAPGATPISSMESTHELPPLASSLSVDSTSEALVGTRPCDLIDADAPQYLECLRSESGTLVSTLSARRSSCSSDASKVSGSSLVSKPSQSDASEVASGGPEGPKNGQYTFDVQYEEEEVEDEEEAEGDASTPKDIEPSEPPTSPYTIDENCDDDFFLNSVLRKKSQPLLNYTKPTMAETMMTSCYPSSTTLSSIRSSATTPSLSGWSSGSSQASTPSPTSPSIAHGLAFSYPTSTSPTTTKTSMHYQYRSNPLPMPIKANQDEKRTRLREAVGEWRRSSNQSS